jgi:DNA polymerase III sliding clamp (beta) subunit (PCNA family)
MNIILDRDELCDALAGLAKVTPRRATLPVLGCIRLEAGPRGVQLHATDLDQFVTHTLGDVRVDKPGVVVLPLPGLQDLVKAAARGSITLATTGADTVQADYQLARQPMARTLYGQDPQDWPVRPDAVAIRPVDGTFLAHFRQAALFAARDPSRLVISGVYLEPHADGDHLVGTDGRRLSAFRLALPFRTPCIVPVHKFPQWARLPGDGLQIGHNTVGEVGWFRMVAGAWDYQVRTTAGVYPNWRQVVPEPGGAYELQLGEQDVALLAKALPTLAGHTTPGGTVTFRGKAGQVTISGQGVHDPVPAILELVESRMEGGNARIAVDRWFLLDALAAGLPPLCVRGWHESLGGPYRAWAARAHAAAGSARAGRYAG